MCNRHRRESRTACHPQINHWRWQCGFVRVEIADKAFRRGRGLSRCCFRELGDADGVQGGVSITRGKGVAKSLLRVLDSAKGEKDMITGASPKILWAIDTQCSPSPHAHRRALGTLLDMSSVAILCLSSSS